MIVLLNFEWISGLFSLLFIVVNTATHNDFRLSIFLQVLLSWGSNRSVLPTRTWYHLSVGQYLVWLHVFGICVHSSLGTNRQMTRRGAGRICVIELEGACIYYSTEGIVKITLVNIRSISDKFLSSSLSHCSCFSTIRVCVLTTELR